MDARLWFCIFAVTVQQSVAASRLATLKHCCELGTNYASSGLECSTFQTPIAGIDKRDQEICFNSVGVCCNNEHRRNDCELGKVDALDGKDCKSSDDAASDDAKHDCCQACQLGIETGTVEMSCGGKFGFEALVDEAFISCCKAMVPTKSADVTTPTLAATTAVATSTAPASTASAAGSTSSASPVTSTPVPQIPSSSTRATLSSTPIQHIDDDYPPLEGICDVAGICAQVCIPTKDSFKCACEEGFTLMSDGISCKSNKRKPPLRRNRCQANNPCEQRCFDTGVSIRCSCYEGYELTKDKKTCKDIDECETKLNLCSKPEICVNKKGSYICVNPEEDYEDSDDFDVSLSNCPEGYKFDSENKLCNDIDECELDIMCSNPKSCKNTLGSFICEENEGLECPQGFRYKDSVDDCEDIDECVLGQDDCNRESQTCLNTKGNFTCIDKASRKSCPPGFKMNEQTYNCDDINECEERTDACEPGKHCINEPGGHTCVFKLPQSERTTTPLPIYKPRRISPFLLSNELTNNSSSTTEKTTIQAYTTTSSTTTETTTVLMDSSKQLTPLTTRKIDNSPSRPPQLYSSNNNFNYDPWRHSYQQPNPQVSCPSGYKLTLPQNSCTEIDECDEDDKVCDSNQLCRNTPGSFYCECKPGFTKDYPTGACKDINECQVGAHDCVEGQRCDNTIGSFLCARIASCGTGYTLNYHSGKCEDDDECELGTHTCSDLGRHYECKNTFGSYRCVPALRKIFHVYGQSVTPVEPQLQRNHPVVTQHKKCLPGYIMNFKGDCEDINECLSNPCRRGQNCLNMNGKYECLPSIQCKIGYELNSEGTTCIDVDECERGTHQCTSTQVCRNAPGYHVCECPPGHKLNNYNHCQDIDECEYYYGRFCSTHSNCINTIGSFRCECKDGLRKVNDTCEDIDECSKSYGLCQQNCVNVWRGYRCSCERGYTLNSDNRTCTDVDECTEFKANNLCIGTCENTPGSYVCKCPNGYKLGSDGRTCQDIDECLTNICQNPDAICLNTRGSYKCHTIVCPPNYIRDPNHKSRCKRALNLCDSRDGQCINMPHHYSYHFMTFISKLPIMRGYIEFFQMKGPVMPESYAQFSMRVKDVRCPYGVRKADESYFKLSKFRHKAIISIVKSIEGPQEIDLVLELRLTYNGIFNGLMVTNIYIVVSEYNF